MDQDCVMSPEELKAFYFEAIGAARAAERLMAEFNLEITRYLEEHKVPPGYNLDLLGTGEILPADQCKRHTV